MQRDKEESVAGEAEGPRNGFDKVLDAAMGIAEAWNEKANKWLRENSVTFTQFKAILLLSRAGSQTLSQLSEGLSRARCTVTGLVDRLEAKGLVKRKRSREDRRQVYVMLTDRGKELAQELKEKVLPEITSLGERIMGRLTESEAAALLGALGKLSEGIGET
ncbi:MAG: MarR family transcriptional regulator [Actinomycetota bacterium]|nr:MarR family transcriptional regulator [Actinomycetota bacterium]